ncbi:MAG: bacillithiol biosynthesis deacetylase BshB1 [Candidatus Jettenia sp.]|uniref:Bacillithiol biosynthesis deacetylase BshB1 n=1 Tax=Candidatus Jettenia caeni TaxID=247490 RepID=I3IRH2_9BACT|nr:bacillithiol biosynthesis deacetylase BshB1 [Candidatus Jettenia sp. AMX1]MBC6928371.1 bacillithiol biosynthesis deacetylase BshB1 [Candidatus Jettenia sp.]WKZ15729.1 MAG: bacillithiol biosynthesis deacetylase BshB1 [Candidatus Jettenia caeni]KAA0250508.1 MAG: bacillithiol biosynthesis deacetylase BshB1 [Candidatus Jettenia sp. AMX1]MCE7879698.1 bacillithiol biosynthesis deacetylase BshB1 [Candidatus Jettenia sp. AMX1]MDL1938237.1 bacillithiol biosynthesis deacetylase BshB1 [Candidatus Jett
MTTILAIGPHPDDIEAGMGGSILKLVSLGYDVHILDMTNGEPTPYGSPEIRKREWELSATVLGIKSRTVLDLPNRYLMDSIDARKKVAAVIREIRPEVIFLPYWVDAHPDHVQTTQIGEAARFYAKLTKSDIPGEPWYPACIFYYLCSHFRLHVIPSFILDISREFEKKLKIASIYQSQFAYDEARWKQISNTITAKNQYYGNLIRADYGEPFMSREQIGLRDIRDII